MMIAVIVFKIWEEIIMWPQLTMTSGGHTTSLTTNQEDNHGKPSICAGLNTTPNKSANTYDHIVADFSGHEDEDLLSEGVLYESFVRKGAKYHIYILKYLKNLLKFEIPVYFEIFEKILAADTVLRFCTYIYYLYFLRNTNLGEHKYPSHFHLICSTTKYYTRVP